MEKESLILIIDDEPQILRALKTILIFSHFSVISAMTGEQGIALAAAQKPDVIILDLALPDMDGIEVCERIREWTTTPIIVLSVRDRERDKVAALDKGADDYLTKPFDFEELLARIRVAIRRSARIVVNKEPIITTGSLTIDFARHITILNGIELKLTSTEFKLLSFMAEHADRVLTQQAIMIHIWGVEESDHIEYLRVYIGQLRKKIELNPDDPKIIVTEPGVGYRFISE
jgi:two-component system, OmpR family, KDP operon response regulator KdpE